MPCQSTPVKQDGGARGKRKSAIEDLFQIALQRTPGSRYAVRVFSAREKQHCVATLGSEDLRVFKNSYTPPTVFDLEHTEIKQTRSESSGALGLQIRRQGLLRRICFPVCCCEPLVHIFQFHHTEQEVAKKIISATSAAGTSSKVESDASSCQQLHVCSAESAPRSFGATLLDDLPDSVFDVLASFVHTSVLHEMMRLSSVFRSRLGAEEFWQGIYLTHLPQATRDQVDLFDDTKGKSYRDKVSVARLRFCHECFARRHAAGHCHCGVELEFNSFIRFDIRLYELRRLGLNRLSGQLWNYAFDMASAELCHSTRYHGYSLRQLLLRASGGERRLHLLVCEAGDGYVFGAFLGFPLKRFSSRAYGSSNCFLFQLGSLEQPNLCIFHLPDVETRPARSLSVNFSLGVYEEIALGLSDDLRAVTCEPSPWCEHASLSHHSTVLRSVTIFSHGGKHESTCGRKSYHLEDGGGENENGANMDVHLLNLMCTSYIQDYFA